MIGLDTNVLVRYVVRDDPGQTAAAARLIESECTADSPGIVTLIGLCAREEGAESTRTFDRKAAGSGLFKVIGGAGPRVGAT